MGLLNALSSTPFLVQTAGLPRLEGAEMEWIITWENHLCQMLAAIFRSKKKKMQIGTVTPKAFTHKTLFLANISGACDPSWVGLGDMCHCLA